MDEINTTEKTGMDTTTSASGKETSSDSTDKDSESSESSNDSDSIECTKAGFFRNPNNCSKFYRCVDYEGNGKSFRIFHFECSKELVFDEKLSVCTWPDQAQPPCKLKDSERKKDETETKDEESERDDGMDTGKDTTKDGESERDDGMDTGKDTTKDGDKVSTDETATKPSSEDNDKSTEKDGDNISTEKTKTTDDENNIQDDHPDKSDKSSESSTETANDSSTNAETNEIDDSMGDSKNKSSSEICTEEGYFRNPEDCRKFYRCVPFKMDKWNLVICIIFHLCILIYGHKSRRYQHGFRCRQVGLFSHPTNCGKFFRCTIKEGKRRHYALLTLSCPPSLVYNERTKSCSIVPVSPSCLVKEHSNSTRPFHRHSLSSNKYNCIKEGIFPHPTDCKKFYRCADYDGKGKSLTAFEYSCPEGLLFNKEIDTCDWPDFSPPCDDSLSDKQPFIIQTEKKGITKTSKLKKGNEKKYSLKCKKSGFFRDPDDCRKFYRCVSYSESGKKFHIYNFKCPKSLVFDERLSTCNWPSKNISCNINIDDDDEDKEMPKEIVKITRRPTLPKSTPSPKEEETYPCVKEGFFRHPENCSRFFRCIKRAKHFKSYSFSCQNNLVFDERISSCNWPEKSPACFDNFVVISKPPKHIITNPNLFHDQKRAERHPRSLSLRESPPIFPYLSAVYYENSQRSMKGIFVAKHGSDSDLKCEKEGIFKHPKFCHEFYVCSDFDNTKTNYKIFEFVCPNDMVYDEELDDCVEPPPDSPCAHHKEKCKHDGSETNDTTDSESDKEKDTTDSSEDKDKNTKSPDDSDLATDSPKDDESSEKPTKENENSEKPAEEDESSEQPSKDDDSSSSKNKTAPIKCKKSGFFRHPDDCNRFYRCVDYNNDSKSFVIYEFRCGENLVFDEVNSVCNWPSAVPECSSGSGKPSSKDDSGTSDGDTTNDDTGEQTETTPGTSEENTSESSKDIPGSEGDNTSESSESTSSSEGDNTSESSESTPSGEGDNTSESEVTKDPDSDCEDKETTTEDPGKNAGDKSNDDKDDDNTSTPKADEETKTTTETDDENRVSTPKMDESTDKSKSDNNDTDAAECKKSGYFRNPKNCSKFYRCVDHSGDGKAFKIYHFDCPSGLVFDEVLSVCNWPDQAQPPCKGNTTDSDSDDPAGGKDEPSDGKDEPSDGKDEPSDGKDEPSDGKDGPSNGKDEPSDGKDEPSDGKDKPSDGKDKPSDGKDDSSGDESATKTTTPQDDKDPDCETSEDENTSTKETDIGDDNKNKETTEKNEGESTKSMDEINTTEKTGMDTTTSASGKETSSDSTDKDSESSESSNDSDSIECTKAGFFRNPNNCSKFYRCVDYEGNGKSFRIFHFECSKELVFDEKLSVCTWPDQAQPPCKLKDSERKKDETETKDGESERDDGMDTGKDTTKDGDKVSTDETATKPSSEDNDKSTEKDGDNISTEKTKTTDDENNIQDDHPDKSDKSSESSTETANDSSTNAETNEIDDSMGDSKNKSSSEICTEEGYFRNPEDCRKFYRCVDYEGNGTSFTIFHFDCPENTAFDDILDVCVWPEQARPPCDSSGDGKAKNETMDERGDKTTKDPAAEEGSTDESTEKSGTSDEESDKVTKESPDKRTTTQSTNENENKETTDKGSEDGSATTEGDQDVTDDSNQTDNSSDSSNLCKESGYFRHPEDCNKFYRCVDYSGNGTSFKIFHFKCPENTVFDDVLDVCVWPEQAQPPCDTDSSGKSDNDTSSEKQETPSDSSDTTKADSTSTITSTEESMESSSTDDKGTESTSTEKSVTEDSSSSTTPKKKKPCPDKSKTKTTAKQTTTTESSKNEGSEKENENTSNENSEVKSKDCSKAGFFRNPDDCNKFYRCVDNGDKSFRVYNFNCPENTVFDEEKDVCVWPGQESPPCGGKNENSEENNIIPDGSER
ncbi:dentin sialophosphoprotein-like [Centruroides sculpturatus]|uniref:dentin sialophosphoprotein-like n=1 Tax=Centruroides sculpturatus TaxID=218467 RepID=UPI000C6D324B|nr:dentin sialophosphoprotein-like [Centruroides sculpturatus]